MGITINAPENNNPSTASSATGPLSSLYTNATGTETLKYPSNLGSDQRNHYVQLYIKNVESASYKGEKLQATTGGIDIGGLISKGSLLDTAQQAVNTIGDALFGNSQLKTAFTSPLSLSFTPQTTSTVAVISLYMPDTLTAAYNASYDSLSLTNDLGATAKTAQAIATAGGQLASGGNIASMGPAALVAGEQLGLGQLATKASLNYKNISDLLLKGQGVAINPQMQMIYRGTNFRSFQLTFMFTPNSKSEAETVNKIINTLRYHFAPSLASGTTSNQSMFLIPPSIFGVVFKLGADENKFLPKYGDCVLENIDVDTAPNGWASYDDGAPVQTRLTLQFKEIVILDRGKVSDGVKGLQGGLR